VSGAQRMKIRRLSIGFVGLLASFVAGAAAAQDLKLIGLDGQTATLTPADIAALPHVTLTLTVEGKTATYKGVPLTDILAKVGAPSGKALKGPELRDVVLVEAKDGYAVALALAETDALVRKDQILLADASDGAPLPDGLGPYRLVVEGDQRGARLARMVTQIELKRLAPTP
jgi:DMSO/TMAO reductase YedYZ molybdopterin-dependent catalytic subunit